MARPGPGRLLQVGAWRVDTALDLIQCGERVEKLEPRMMRLLCCLAERPGEVFSADEILAAVWPGVVVGPNSVYQAVAQLRRLLADTGDQPAYIATVPRKGYRLVAPVRAIESGSAPPVSAVGGEDHAVSSVPRHASMRLRLAGIGAAIIVAIAAAWVFTRGSTPAEAGVAVAVLPFADLSSANDNQDFCDGLAEEVLNSLARVPGLRVTGRTSAFRFRKRVEAPEELGRTLGVSHILEGSVRRNGERLRVSAQLVSTRDGFVLWANSFDRASAGAITVQTEISQAVVDALKIQLSADARGRLNRGPSATVSAYELYLLGRHQQLQRNPDALARAVEYHRLAIDADPRFALAHAGLADAYMAGYYYQNRTLKETAPLVEREVDAALRLDPQLAEAHAARAVLLAEQRRPDEAVTALEHAIAINSNYGEAYVRLGAAHEYAGRPVQALAAYDQALALDPLHAILHVRRCLTLQNLGRYAEAERACNRAIELQPEIPNAYWARGLCAWAQGDLPAAIHSYELALLRAPHRLDIRGELALLLLDVGLPERARREIDAARQYAGPDDLGVALVGAQLRVATGETAALLAELRARDFRDAGPQQRLEAAYLAMIGGDALLADRLRTAALASPSFSEESIRPGVYDVRWGSCGMCALAFLERARGNTVAADRYLGVVRDYLTQLVKAGHRWHGLEYVRATMLAQQGRESAALASLTRAYEMGGRRAWLMRTDPALAALRRTETFTSIIQRIDASNAHARSILSGQIPTR